MPELSREVAGVLEGLLRDAGDAAAAAAEAAIDATGPGAGAALARPEVVQLLRTDPLYRAAVEGAAGAVSPEEMGAYFAVRRRRRRRRCHQRRRRHGEGQADIARRGRTLTRREVLSCRPLRRDSSRRDGRYGRDAG